METGRLRRARPSAYYKYYSELEFKPPHKRHVPTETYVFQPLMFPMGYSLKPRDDIYRPRGFRSPML